MNASPPSWSSKPRAKPPAVGQTRGFDATAGGKESTRDRDMYRVDWFRCLPFFAVHFACLGVFWVGWSPTAVTVAATLYVLRAFALTAFYHRCFSHRAFKTSRWLQFVFAMIGNAAMQRGPLWWAAHHRSHHAHSDHPGDVHSPWEHGFLWSHMLWFTSRQNFVADLRMVPDLSKFPELRLMDRFDYFMPLLLAASMYGLGETLAVSAPGLGVDGWQLLMWGFFISTVALFHATSAINSLAHRVGSRRYATRDESRNNLWLALATLGEGWHNNHHHYPNAARQGFFWWEIDITYYVLIVFSWLGLVWDLKTVPPRVRDAAPRSPGICSGSPQR